MSFLLNNFKELNYGDLLAVNGGCSGSCSGFGNNNPNLPKTTKTENVYGPDSSTRLAASINYSLENNKPYVFGVNDCDIWTENVLKNAGLDISKAWGPAESNYVSDHEKNLAKLTTDAATTGWSVVLMTDSTVFNINHCGIVKVETDGSVSFYQNSESAGKATAEKYSSVKAFQNAYAYTDFDYLKITN